MAVGRWGQSGPDNLWSIARGEDVPLSDAGIRLLVRLIRCRQWRVPTGIYANVPPKLCAYLENLDPSQHLRQYDRAVRVLLALQDDNLMQDRRTLEALTGVVEDGPV